MPDPDLEGGAVAELGVVDRVAASRQISRADVIDAAARVIARRCDHGVRWTTVAYEAGDAPAVMAAPQWLEDLPALIDECYARTAQGLSDSLLCAETAPGTALDKVAAFLVSALETRRSRGVYLSFRRGADLPLASQRRLNEHDFTVRMRLKRLLGKGRRDGSLASRNPDSAVELLLASLQVPTVVADGPEQRMWDSELVELLLAALSEPHPSEVRPHRDFASIHRSCRCGAVRYDLDGPYEAVSHCQCSLCRNDYGASRPGFVSVPLSGFRWVSGENEISTYESPECGRRAFCRQCGSVTPIIDPEGAVALCPQT